MKLKLIVRYTGGTSQVFSIDPDDNTTITEAMNSTDFESLTLTRVRHAGDGIFVRETKARVFNEGVGC